MLHPTKDRLDYGALLSPPEGFQLDNAIATSYSLDLDALVSIPVALYFTKSLDIDLKQNAVQILDAIRRAAEDVKIFCQKGQIKVPDNQHRLYSFIENCVYEIPPTVQDSFHPKVWVLRFSNNIQELKYRVVVLSRNLTFDRSWDVAFQMEGDTQPHRKATVRKSKPLVDFVKYLTAFSNATWFEQFISDLARTEFNLTDDFDDFSFVPSGIPGYKQNPVFNDTIYDEALVISPFVNKGGLDFVINNSKTIPSLFCREFELRRLKSETLSRLKCYHLLNDYVEGEAKLDTETEREFLNQQQDIHAKLYAFKNGWQATILMGSANCTGRAMTRNVEFMVQLAGKNSRIGPEILLKELLNDDLSVFTKYTHHEELSEQEKLSLSREEALHVLKVRIVNSVVKARAIKQDDGNFAIELRFDLRAVSKINDVSISCYLLRSDNQKQILEFGAENSWSLLNISELDLSCFLALELGYTTDPKQLLKFAMKIEIESLPSSRTSNLFRDIISNSANFLKYIRFLLAEDFWENQALSSTTTAWHTDAEASIFQSDEPIYEGMLNAISRNPEKLDKIKEVMERLNQDESDGRKIVPEDFKALWKVFDEARNSKNGHGSQS